MSTQKRSGVCSFCLRPIHLKKDGTLFRHTDKRKWEDNYRSPLCEGAGEKPKYELSGGMAQ